MHTHADVAAAPLTAADVLDALPSAAVILDRDACFVAANVNWTQFCIEHDDFVVALRPGDDYLWWCVDEARPVGEGIRAVLARTQPCFRFSYPCRSAGDERWIRVEATPLADGVLVTHVDIGDEFAHLVHWLTGGAEAIVELDADLRANYVSASWTRLATRSAGVGGDWTAPLDPEACAEVHEQLRACLRDGQDFVLDAAGGDRLYRLAGSPHWGEQTEATRGRVVLAITDITERRDAVVRAAADQERTRVAADVHDTVVQRLYGTALDLQRRAGEGAADAQVLHETISRIDRAIGDLRALGRPDPSAASLSDPRSLRQQLDSVLADAEVALGFAPCLRVEVDCDDIDADAVPDLLAVLNEALSNVARHAAAGSCDVHLLERAGHLVLTVTDDGRGMPAGPRRSSGTRNISDRAEGLGGRAMWTPGADGGTVVVWQVPLAAHAVRPLAPVAVGD